MEFRAIILFLLVGFANTLRADDLMVHLQQRVQEWSQVNGIESVYVEIRTPLNKDELYKLSDEYIPFKKGRCAVPVVVTKNNRQHRMLLSVIIHTFERVFITKRTIQANEKITSDLLERRIIETTYLPSDVITGDSVPFQYCAARIIKEQSVLTQSMCKAIPVLNPRDIITLQIRSGNVVLTTKAVAKQTGVVGEVITVLGLETRKQYKARVLDANTVELVAY